MTNSEALNLVPDHNCDIIRGTKTDAHIPATVLVRDHCPGSGRPGTLTPEAGIRCPVCDQILPRGPKPDPIES